MALKKSTNTAAANFADKFEDEGSVATATRDESPDGATSETQSHFEASTAVAKAITTSAVATTGSETAARAKAFQRDFEAMRDAADFSYGIHRVFKAKDGSLKEMKGEKLKLGRWVKVMLLAWGTRVEVAPGEDGKGADGFVAYSKDGKTIDNIIGEEQAKFVGTSVDDYLDYLRNDEDFPRAGKRNMMDLQVAVLDCESAPGVLQGAESVVQVTLSPTSIISFNQYQSALNSAAKCAAMNLPGFSIPENPFEFFLVVEDAENKRGQSWSKVAIKSTLPARL